MAEIVNCDAQDFIKQLDDESIDLVILDPDYNDWIDLIGGGIIEESLRILKRSGNLLCFTKQPFDYELRKKVSPFFRREIVWTFTNGGAWCSNKMPLVSFQKIYWCVKSDGFYFNPRTGQPYGENIKDFKRDTKVFGEWLGEGKQFKKSDDGIWLRDHLHFNKPLSGVIPAKPKELIEILIKCFCPPCGTLYDAFAGSGIVEKVGDELGRKAVATEIDADRYSKIKDALSEADAQMEMDIWKGADDETN